jgi:hypothetical protein
MVDDHQRQSVVSFDHSQKYTLSYKTNESSLQLSGGARTLLVIKPDGTVEADSIESASEAGRVFVESIRHQILNIRVDAYREKIAFAIADSLERQDGGKGYSNDDDFAWLRNKNLVLDYVDQQPVDLGAIADDIIALFSK